MHSHGAIKQQLYPHRTVGTIELDHAAEEVTQNQTPKNDYFCCLGHLGPGVTIDCPAPVGEAVLENGSPKTGTPRELYCQFRSNSQTWLILGKDPTTTVEISRGGRTEQLLERFPEGKHSPLLFFLRMRAVMFHFCRQVLQAHVQGCHFYSGRA